MKSPLSHFLCRLSFVYLCLIPALFAQNEPNNGEAGPENVQPEAMDPGPFYGFWEFQEPAGDKAVIIIKRGGRLSCFWTGTRTRAILKGSWQRSGDQLTAYWENDQVDVFKKLGDNAIERNSFGPGKTLLDTPSLTVRGIRIDSRIPGSLTVPLDGERPEPEEDLPDPQNAPAIPLNNAFIGYWKVDQASGLLSSSEPAFYLRLTRGGEAYVALRRWEGDQAVRGSWQVDGERVIVTWPNTRRDVLEPLPNGGYQLNSFRPRDKLSRSPRNTAKAEKVIAADAERYFDAGTFSRLTVVDIRGTWIPDEEIERREYISIEGWGNAFRYPPAAGGDGNDPGKWRLLTDRVVITWVDGSKDVIRISFPDIVQESYPISEPVTGTPSRTIKVTRSE